MISEASAKLGLSTEVTKREALIVAVMGKENGLPHVMEARQGLLKEIDMPQLPRALADDEEIVSMVPAMFTIAYDLLEKHKLETGFYKGAGDAQDILAQQYGEVVEDYAQAISDYIQEAGLSGTQVARIKRTISLLSKEIGVPTEDRAALTISSLSGDNASYTPKKSVPNWSADDIVAFVEPNDDGYDPQ